MELDILVALCYVLIFAFAANLAMIVSNIIKYLVPLKINSALITLFYMLASVMTFARLTEMVFYILPNKQLKSFNQVNDDTTAVVFANNVATVTNVGIGCLFVATMYQINYAIKMIDDPLVDLVQAERHKIIVYCLAVAFTCFFTVSMILISILVQSSEIQEQWLLYNSTAAYAILPIMYIWIMIELRKNLKDKTANAMSKETKYVIYQFLFFIVSYLTRLLFFIPECIGVTESIRPTFWFYLANLLMYIPWSVLPITFILYMHTRNYSEMKNALQYSKNSSAERNYLVSRQLNEEQVLCSIIFTDEPVDLEDDWRQSIHKNFKVEEEDEDPDRVTTRSEVKQTREGF